VVDCLLRGLTYISPKWWLLSDKFKPSTLMYFHYVVYRPALIVFATALVSFLLFGINIALLNYTRQAVSPLISAQITPPLLSAIDAYNTEVASVWNASFGVANQEINDINVVINATILQIHNITAPVTGQYDFAIAYLNNTFSVLPYPVAQMLLSFIECMTNAIRRLFEMLDASALLQGGISLPTFPSVEILQINESRANDVSLLISAVVIESINSVEITCEENLTSSWVFLAVGILHFLMGIVHVVLVQMGVEEVEDDVKPPELAFITNLPGTVIQDEGSNSVTDDDSAVEMT